MTADRSAHVISISAQPALSWLHMCCLHHHTLHPSRSRAVLTCIPISTPNCCLESPKACITTPMANRYDSMYCLHSHHSSHDATLEPEASITPLVLACCRRRQVHSMDKCDSALQLAPLHAMHKVINCFFIQRQPFHAMHKCDPLRLQQQPGKHTVSDSPLAALLSLGGARLPAIWG